MVVVVDPPAVVVVDPPAVVDVVVDEPPADVDVEDVPLPLVANGRAGTGVVPVQSAAGGSPQPAGDGVPGLQVNVTLMSPPGPTSAVVVLSPRLRATLGPVAVHVEVGTVAVTDRGVAVSSPEVLSAGVGSVIVVVPVTLIGGNVCDACCVPLPNRVRFTFAGMLLTPAVSSPSP